MFVRLKRKLPLLVAIWFDVVVYAEVVFVSPHMI